MPVMSVKAIATGYQRTLVIEDISFTVEASELLGIIGPNGAGKSTLFKAVSRILPLWQGAVLWQGRDMRHIPRRTLARHMAAIPQLVLPFPYSVEEFVRMGRYPHRGRFGFMGQEDRRIVQGLLERLELEGLKDKRINRLSGGEMQRVFLAQGLAQQPELLLMDEPTAHLDIAHQVKIMDIVQGLTRGAGMAAVVILHDLNLASLYCDRIILMATGRIHCQGSPQAVLTREHIEAVYKTRVQVRPEELTGRPHVFVVPQAIRPG